jgi:hypothetical protein
MDYKCHTMWLLKGEYWDLLLRDCSSVTATLISS